MTKRNHFFILFILSFYLPACTVMPEGPAVSVLPGSNQSSSTFERDNMYCQDYAKQLSGNLSPNEVKEEVIGESAFVGALIGAVLGVAIGSSPQDAAIGALSGALFGGLAGNTEGTMAAADIQYEYDKVYTQCMYSAGHRVPATNIKYIEQAPKLAPKKTTPFGVPPDFK